MLSVAPKPAFLNTLGIFALVSFTLLAIPLIATFLFSGLSWYLIDVRGLPDYVMIFAIPFFGPFLKILSFQFYWALFAIPALFAMFAMFIKRSMALSGKILCGVLILLSLVISYLLASSTHGL